MKILVTGGLGFIGSHIIGALREDGHAVSIFDSRSSGLIDPLTSDEMQGDILSVHDLQHAFNSYQPEIVFHTAAIADARACLDDPLKAVQVNIGGTAHILDVARRTPSVKRVVLSSTCWVANAMHTGILDESASFLPQGGGHVYTTAKIASEMLCHDFQKLYGLDFTILRYGIPYGPGMWPGLVLQNWMDNARKEQPIVIFGDGSITRRFVHVQDLAAAHALAVPDAARNQTYNLEGMRAVSIKELAQVFRTVWEQIAGHTVDVKFEEQPNRVGELVAMRTIISNAKAFAELGWEPHIDLEYGLRSIVSDYLQKDLGLEN